jgi:O-antigen ligase
MERILNEKSILDTRATFSRLAWFAAFAISLVTVTFQVQAMLLTSLSGMIVILIVYILLSSGITIEKNRNVFLALVLIFIYSIIFSRFTARSALFSLTYLFSFLLYCTLCDLKIATQADAPKMNNLDYSQLSKLALAIYSLCHAIYLIYQYSMNPIRSTGFFLDYSQASLFILISFTLTYSYFKQHPITGSLLTFVLFLGFFTTYSRTCNFLLIFILGAIATYEWNKGGLKYIAWLGLTITIAYLCIYTFPVLMEVDTVNRGGITQFATLNSRVFYWGAAIDAIKIHPFIGNGLGNFEFLGIKDIYPFNLINSVHNDYLQIWVDLGLFWFLAFIAFLTRNLIKHRPTYSCFQSSSNAIQETKTLDRYLAWCLLAALCMYMLINFAIHTFIFQILIAIIFAELSEND